jgi:Fur family ferric uptake transcriptional regulator
MNRTQALKKLSDSKHKVTRTRELILDSIFKLKNPFAADDIQRVSSKRGLDLVTIYRNLPVFEEVGIICRADFSDDKSRYVIADKGHDHHHHHIVCTECREIQPIDFCVIEGQEQILRKLGFTHVTHRLEFSGICPRCSA